MSGDLDDQLGRLGVLLRDLPDAELAHAHAQVFAMASDLGDRLRQMNRSTADARRRQIVQRAAERFADCSKLIDARDAEAAGAIAFAARDLGLDVAADRLTSLTLGFVAAHPDVDITPRRDWKLVELVARGFDHPEGTP